MLGKLKRLLLEKLGINSIDQNLLLIRQAIEEKTCNLESRIINAERNICHQIDINRHEIRRITGFLLNDLVQESDEKGNSIGLGLDQWKLRELEGLLRSIRKNQHLESVQKGLYARLKLETQHPVALYSQDTKKPRGAKNDNSFQQSFNNKLFDFYPNDGKPLNILDLGCAGGGLVRSLLDDGHFAIGLEGSDFPKTHGLGEWSTIPGNLFNCDITEPFLLAEETTTSQPFLFDIVTAWEVLEHIPEERIPQLMGNIRSHLKPEGRIIFSIATFPDLDEATGTNWHVCVHQKPWWVAKFKELGYDEITSHPFGKEHWLRGSGHCRGDWHEDDGKGFHLILKPRE
jgi:SAM-dependent methyltransferase